MPGEIDESVTPEPEFDGRVEMPREVPPSEPLEPDFEGVPTTAKGLFAAAMRGTPPPPELGAEIEMTLGEKLRAKRKGKPRPRGNQLQARELTGQIVALRIKGTQIQTIADHLGIAKSTVTAHVDRWLAEMEPTESQTENLRKLMNTRLEVLHERYWQAATGIQNEDGSWRMEPDLRAGEFILKLYDRKAKVMGLDFQPSQVTMMVSAESIAAFLGWDPDAPAQGGVIDMLPAAPPPPAELGDGGVVEGD